MSTYENYITVPPQHSSIYLPLQILRSGFQTMKAKKSENGQIAHRRHLRLLVQVLEAVAAKVVAVTVAVLVTTPLSKNWKLKKKNPINHCPSKKRRKKAFMKKYRKIIQAVMK